MHLKISKAVLENIVSTVINFTDKKDESQIISHILIEAYNNKIKFKATDKEFGIEFQNDAEIIEEGQTTINGKRFYEIIKALNNDSIIIQTENNYTKITQNHSVYKLSMFDSKEFPIFPETTSLKKITLNSLEFINGLKKIFPTIDTNNPKYELNGALLDIQQNTLNLVATDTKRLALYSINENIENNMQIIIPKKAISEIRKLFIDNFELYFDNINLIIKTKNLTFFTKLINGKFPDYKRIIPSEYKYIIDINKLNFLKALKQINIISQEIKINIKNNIIEIESISEDKLEAKTEIEIKSDINSFRFAVNSRFILDFLNVVDEEFIELCLNEENIPFSLKTKNYQTIIMPITI